MSDRENAVLTSGNVPRLGRWTRRLPVAGIALIAWIAWIAWISWISWGSIVDSRHWYG
ncbi:hypothetical protein [Streptomyces naphthomycinicus]|uniref:hypothetical protein n=1 Tax=Streptomyces naphthomycinicus TaxID=2872625 RepID=UPI001CEC3D55|nr:hypothetical protein [Streptomyces sp. TML10]